MENTELSWPKIDDRLDRLTMDAGEIDMEVTVREKKEMVVQALMPDQQRGLLSDIKKQHPHIRVADLTQISWEIIEEWMIWYASFERKGPTKKTPRERANRAKENTDRRPRCYWYQQKGHFMNKCRDKAAGKPRVPLPEQSGSPPPQ